MARFVDEFEPPRGYEVSEGGGPLGGHVGPITRSWRKFLAGPHLLPGPSLAIMGLGCLLFWAAVAGLFLYFRHR
jgi:hypothetical protein